MNAIMKTVGRHYPQIVDITTAIKLVSLHGGSLSKGTAPVLSISMEDFAGFLRSYNDLMVARIEWDDMAERLGVPEANSQKGPRP